MFSQIKDIKHIEQKFHSVTWVMPQWWDLGVLGGGGRGGGKNLRGFAMAPYRLQIDFVAWDQQRHSATCTSAKSGQCLCYFNLLQKTMIAKFKFATCNF